MPTPAAMGDGAKEEDDDEEEDDDAFDSGGSNDAGGTNMTCDSAPTVKRSGCTAGITEDDDDDDDAASQYSDTRSTSFVLGVEAETGGGGRGGQS